VYSCSPQAGLSWKCKDDDDDDEQRFCAASMQTQEVDACFSVLIGGLNDRGMLLLLPSLETVLSASPAALPALRPALTKLTALLLAGQVGDQHIMCMLW
jgi:hypothetical protein